MLNWRSDLGRFPHKGSRGAEGNRTPGLNSAIVALYQLSYSPERIKV